MGKSGGERIRQRNTWRDRPQATTPRGKLFHSPADHPASSLTRPLPLLASSLALAFTLASTLA